MASFKLQYGQDILRKSLKGDVTFLNLQQLVTRTFLNVEKTYKFYFNYEDSDEDQITIANDEDLALAFEHHSGEALKIYVGAKEVDLKEKAYKHAFKAGFALLDGGQPEESIPHFAEALKHKKDPLSAYNIACAFSLLDNLFESLKWFRCAIDLGYKNWIWALKDPDLANVRNTSDFHQELESIRGSIGQCGSFFQPYHPTAGRCGQRSTSTGRPECRTGSCQAAKASAQAVPASEVSTKPAPEFTPKPTPQADEQRDKTVPEFGSEQSQLAAMGFVDSKKNHTLLLKHNGDIIKVVHELLFA